MSLEPAPDTDQPADALAALPASGTGGTPGIRRITRLAYMPGLIWAPVNPPACPSEQEPPGEDHDGRRGDHRLPGRPCGCPKLRTVCDLLVGPRQVARHDPLMVPSVPVGFQNVAHAADQR